MGEKPRRLEARRREKDIVFRLVFDVFRCRHTCRSCLSGREAANKVFSQCDRLFSQVRHGCGFPEKTAGQGADGEEARVGSSPIISKSSALINGQAETQGSGGDQSLIEHLAQQRFGTAGHILLRAGTVNDGIVRAVDRPMAAAQTDLDLDLITPPLHAHYATCLNRQFFAGQEGCDLAGDGGGKAVPVVIPEAAAMAQKLTALNFVP